MCTLRCLASVGLTCLAAGATADTGLKFDATGGYWFGSESRLRLQAVPMRAEPIRLGYSSAAALSQLAPVAASLTGDYYFSSGIVEPEQPRTGFRASGALLVRQPGISLSDTVWTSRSVASFGGAPRLTHFGLTPDIVGPQAYSVSTVPYLGIGYSDVSLKSGWGWWADVGVAVQSPGNAVGFGRVLSGTQGVDDLLRELRMAPMVQLGVNYAF